MLTAYARAKKAYQLELHAAERPVALNTQLLANLNRDSKKQKKPIPLEEFFLYQPREERDLPSGSAGAAAMELIKQRVFPSWALFCYKELAAGAAPEPPTVLAFISKAAILLAPQRTASGGYKGLLIALEEGGDRWTTMESPCGKQVQLFIPPIPTKVVAEDSVTLRSR